MHDFQQLRVWQEAIELAVETYGLTATFPTTERYGLTNQMNRAGVSIPSNIAEGAGRNTNGEFGHFLGIASGSCAELYTQLVIAGRLGYGDAATMAQVSGRLDSVHKMLFRLKNSIG